MGDLVRTPHSEVTATLEALEKLDVGQSHFRRVRSDHSYAERVADAFLGRTAGVLKTYDAARELLGDRFFGVEEWLAFYGHRVKPVLPFFPWLDVLVKPCPFEKGKRVAETHFAFFGFMWFRDGTRFTISRVTELEPEYFSLDTLSPYRGENWLERFTCDIGWYLMYPRAVPGTAGKSPARQKELLPQGYVAPTISEYVIGKVLLWKKTNLVTPQTVLGVTELTWKKLHFEERSLDDGVPAIRNWGRKI